MHALDDEHENLVWTFDRAARAVGVSPRHLRNLVRNGKGPAVTKLGRRVVVRKDTLADWLRMQELGGRS